MRRSLPLLALGMCACATATGAPAGEVLMPSPRAERTVDPFAGYPIEPAWTEEDPFAALARDGQLSRDELATLLARETDERRAVRDEAQVTALFSAWDADGDGVLEGDELVTARADLAPERLDVRLAELGAGEDGPDVEGFRYWDDDADGVLTEEELTRETVQRWDANDDGVLDQSEWPA